MPVLCDLDGVVWLAHHPIAGSVAAIARLRAAGHRVLFVTNNSAARISDHESALEAIGVTARGDVLSSAMAVARLVAPGSRVLSCAGAGVVEALERRGAVVVAEGDVDAVVVGWHRTFDYEGLRRAARAVDNGALLLAANDDPTYPTPEGSIPGGGAILAAVETATGRRAIIAGKPHAPMAELVTEAIGDPRHALMVGDRPSTDGAFAGLLGCRFALVLSGVTRSSDGVEPAADLVCRDLAALADLVVTDE
ncbi:MAG: HAD-IIA family hydrolase [Ilumatobacteraceae bacterium]